MAEPRPVRIPRMSSGGPTHRRTTGDEEPRRVWDAEAASPSEFEPNREGTARAARLFALFGLGLAVIFAIFVSAAATSPAPGVSHSATVYAMLVLVTVLLGAVGATITIFRAPRGVSFGAEFLLVTERLGRRRRWPLPPQLRIRVVQRYAGGVLGIEPTELVEVSDGEGHRSSYLVGRGFFDRLERAP